MTWDTDSEFEARRITAVTEGAEGWSLYFDVWGLFCPRDQCGVAPTAGETARLYGKGFGYVVRGIIIEGRVYKYLTEEQEKQRHADWCAEQTRQREAEFERDRAVRDARRAALPEALRERMNGYEKRNPNWRRDYEGYELFVCEEAATLAAHFGADVEALRAFSDKPTSEQEALVPTLRYREHSGNTWGAAVHLAMRLVTDPKLVRGAHGALCPLVGCTEYGCEGAA